MKQLRALSLLLLFLLSGCGGSQTELPAGPAVHEKPVELTFWTYPVGDWGNPAALSSLLNAFQKEYPNIRISVEFLTYENGDDRIARAAREGALPDLVFEGPERLVSGWGNAGLMADLTDLWEEAWAADIYEPVRAASQGQDGRCYLLPLAMSAHCMAINYDLFEAAGALEYLDLENRTWSDQDFVHALEALAEYGCEEAGAVYCGGQGGDQGTRALVNNLGGGSFTDEDHTHYTVDSPETIQALQLLYDLENIAFDSSLVGSGEVDRFCRGELAMAFCWNGTLAMIHSARNPNLSFRVVPMTFPVKDGGEPRLEGGIWGFGIFDSGDAERVAAAKTFIRYVLSEETPYDWAVRAANCWPVRPVEDLYENDAMMEEYSLFTRYVGSYYQNAPDWDTARTAWWQMLQAVGRGEDIAAAVRTFSERVNG